MKKYIHRGLTARKHQLREGQHRKTSPPSSTATVDPLKKTGSNGGSFGAWCFFFSSCKDVLLLLGIGIKRRLSYLHFTLWNVYTRKITRKLYHLLRNLIFYPVQESHLLRKPLLLFTYICIYIYISAKLWCQTAAALGPGIPNGQQTRRWLTLAVHDSFNTHVSNNHNMSSYWLSKDGIPIMAKYKLLIYVSK